MQTVRLYDMRMHTRTLGPGVRAAVWFQGCARRCKGCMSPGSRPLDGGRTVRVEDVADALRRADDIEGVTVSGGEPFLQIGALHELLRILRAETELGVIIYTGYTLAELRAMHDPAVDEILDGLADLLIDGEYVDGLNDGGSLRGSSNQTVHFLTERYRPYASMYGGAQRSVEVIVSGSEAMMIGIPDRAMLEQWKKSTKRG